MAYVPYAVDRCYCEQADCTDKRTISQANCDLLPKDKFDSAQVEYLKTISRSTIAPLMGSLLEWIQDTNWPISSIIWPLLKRYPDLLVGPIHHILRAELDDSGWKCNILNLVAEFTTEQKRLLRANVQRIANSPTAEETADEADEFAKDMLLEGRGDSRWA